MIGGLTFGICTSLENPKGLAQMVQSIVDLQIPEYEIIVAATVPRDTPVHFSDLPSNIQYLIHSGWLPAKKNAIARIATYDTLVLAHDYYLFHPRWYKAYNEFTNAWDICTNPQQLINGERHATDWIVWDSPIYPRYYSLPYNDWSNTKHQYISGGYFLVRKQVLLDYPMNETLLPGSPEDVEWSLRVRDSYKIVCNPDALVRHNKPHRDLETKFPMHLMGR